MLEKILRELTDRRDEMSRSVFESPPQDWPSFQRRFGQFEELAMLIEIVTKTMAGNETDEV